MTNYEAAVSADNKEFVANGKAVQMYGYVKDGAALIERQFKVSIFVWKESTQTWFGLRLVDAWTVEQANEYYSKGVAWANR